MEDGLVHFVHCNHNVEIKRVPRVGPLTHAITLLLNGTIQVTCSCSIVDMGVIKFQLNAFIFRTAKTRQCEQ